MNPPFGTKHNKGLDMKFLQVESPSSGNILIACAFRLAWKWHPELCIRFTKAQPETMSCQRQRSGGQKEGISDLFFCCPGSSIPTPCKDSLQEPVDNLQEPVDNLQEPLPL